MPECYLGAVQTLIEVCRNNQVLFLEIQLAVQRIKRKPTIGDHIKKSYRVYIDPLHRFRIGYNYNPQTKDLEIVLLHLL